MSKAYNYFCCINIYQVLIINNHDYFINKITSSQVEHNHNTRRVNRKQRTLQLYRYVEVFHFQVFQENYTQTPLPPLKSLN